MICQTINKDNEFIACKFVNEQNNINDLLIF